MLKKRKMPWIPCDPLYIWCVCQKKHIWPTLRITLGYPIKCDICEGKPIFMTQTREEAELEL